MKLQVPEANKWAGEALNGFAAPPLKLTGHNNYPSALAAQPPVCKQRDGARNSGARIVRGPPRFSPNLRICKAIDQASPATACDPPP